MSLDYSSIYSDERNVRVIDVKDLKITKGPLRLIYIDESRRMGSRDKVCCYDDEGDLQTLDVKVSNITTGSRD